LKELRVPPLDSGFMAIKKQYIHRGRDLVFIRER